MNDPVPTDPLRDPGGAVLKHTTSRCPVCGTDCPAEVWKSDDAPARVYLTRTCPEHGEATACISSDARFYYVSKGASENSCCGGTACSAADGSEAGPLGRNATAEAGGACEVLSTCLALIEIVDTCNLACPTCYAASPVGTEEAVREHRLEDIQARIQGVIDRKGGIEIIQLSGGEPTLHSRFFELLEWTQAHPKIDYTLINTNGLRLARDDAFATELGRRYRYGGVQLYLQFDGPHAAGQRELRGADLRAVRLDALARCRDMNLPVTLAMTVTAANRGHLWDAIAFGLTFDNVRGITFQPLFTTGRVPDALTGDRLNTADIITGAVEQSRGKLRYDDFTPLPCGDPNCATIGYLLKLNGRVRSISDFVDFARVQGFLADRVRYRLEDLMQCGCESEPLGELLKQFELDERHTFRLFIKPFMDRWSWDQDRVDRCCTHVIRPDGQLDSFCRYYAAGGAAA